MKKEILIKFSLLFIVVLIVTGTAWFRSDSKLSEMKDMSNTCVNGISENILRFHVIANSDSAEDQRVKLKVRDTILETYRSSMLLCKNRNEAIKFLDEKRDTIIKIADNVLQSNNKEYKATASIGDFPFPPKVYGDIVLPAGKYTALKVILGKGGGKNWWCVMFPPLCFIDMTTGYTTEESDKSLSKVISPKILNNIKINNKSKETVQKNKQTQGNYELRFKFVDLVKNILKK